MKGIPPLHRRKATTADVSNKHHHERGIRSDGLWINVLGENGSGSTFVSSYTDTTVFSEASKDPGLLLLSDRKIVLQQLFSPPPPIVDSLTISSMWLNDLESDMPLDPSTLPVYQVNQSYSNRAPISNGIELSLPSTNVSPLVPIIEEDTEEEEEEQEKEENVIEDWDEQRTDVESIGQTTRPISWSATSVDTARSSSNNQAQSQSSKSKSIKRKPVPKS